MFTDDAPPGSPQMGTRAQVQPNQMSRHRLKSLYFKYSAEYWLRTQMTEQKTLDFVMQKKQKSLQSGPRLTMIGRERTRSRPRDRASDKEFEYRFHRERNHRELMRICTMYRNDKVSELRKWGRCLLIQFSNLLLELCRIQVELLYNLLAIEFCTFYGNTQNVAPLTKSSDCI